MMKSYRIVCIGFIGLLLSTGVKAQQTETLNRYLQQGDLKGLKYQKFAHKALSREQAEQALPLLVAAWKKEVKAANHREWEEKCFVHEDRQMKFDYRIFGTLPSDGRSLYISMHGGGNVPKEVNDRQWENQKVLYTPREGVYVAPRAPRDNWNMWFQPGMDEFFEQLIQSAVVELGVNPDKVYLMGYSAGGDGVWRMAPRMADRWAASSMMAGHPGEASQVNLLNVPYQIWMGQYDSAYDRNVLAMAKGRVLDSLQCADPSGYIHQTHIVPGKGHWMERQDTVAVEWMSCFRRQALPQKVVWRQEDVVRPAMYWLAVNPKMAEPGSTVIVRHQGNDFEIVRCDYPSVRICLNDEMVNMDEPIRVSYMGRTLYRGKVRRTLADMAQTLLERGDCRWVFGGYIDVKIK